MGTRCDFYVGRGEKAEWLGSVAWDGDPQNFEEIIKADNEGVYRIEVTKELKGRDDGTLPENGWPWPWTDSRTTDYAVAFEDGKVWASCFGREWYDPKNTPEDEFDGPKTAVFPNMKLVQNVDFGKRSGLLFVGEKKNEEDPG